MCAGMMKQSFTSNLVITSDGWDGPIDDVSEEFGIIVILVSVAVVKIKS